MTELEELRLAYAECSRQRFELLAKLKNLLQETEPVALGHKEKDKYEFVPTAKWFGELPDGVHHLYTSPPKRTWVGLTDDELKPICDEYRILFGYWVNDFARAIEAKLKEKNT